jgi:type III restriction enzyme
LGQSPTFLFEDEPIRVDRAIWDSLAPEDICRYVFNADSWGEIEVLVRPSNRQEMAFKLKTADRPFALIKIGDISAWLKEKLSGYAIAERFDDESLFARLNADDSDINILMGSRSFYEGWDSNRPNVICYINIGTGTDAQKFILQSVGRGVRIEPIKNKRKRLLPLYNAGEVEQNLFQRLKDAVQPLETLFIFGTNRHCATDRSGKPAEGAPQRAVADAGCLQGEPRSEKGVPAHSRLQARQRAAGTAEPYRQV